MANLDDSKDPFFDLHLEEYRQLRAEQRTRQDSANRILQYYAAILAGVVAGLLAVYGREHTDFRLILGYVFLVLPLVTVPFVFAQQNEEIIIRNIGTYFGKLRQHIVLARASQVWRWEDEHLSNRSWLLHLTGFFRAGLLLVFAVLSYGYGLFLYLNDFESNRTCIYSLRTALLIVDTLLVITALSTASMLSRRRLRGVSHYLEVPATNPPKSR